ncbi:TPA: glycogen/starch/alpha-glucan phosphorylase, partial [Streptococcus agalactiae]
YDKDKVIREAVDFIISDDIVSLGNAERLKRLHDELVGKDWFMTLIDLKEYIAVKEQVLADYEDYESWNKKVIHNIAKAGFFSSDRTIEQYNQDIWHSN